MTEKKTIVRLFCDKMEESLRIYDDSIKVQQDFIADSPGPMQSRYDTAMVESQWLLSSIKKGRSVFVQGRDSLNALANEGKVCSTVCNGALVVANANGKIRHFLYLSVSGCGGATVVHDGVEYTVITPESQVGRILAGKIAGDKATLRTTRPVSYTIVSVE